MARIRDSYCKVTKAMEVHVLAYTMVSYFVKLKKMDKTTRI